MQNTTIRLILVVGMFASIINLDTVKTPIILNNELASNAAFLVPYLQSYKIYIYIYMQPLLSRLMSEYIC